MAMSSNGAAHISVDVLGPGDAHQQLMCPAGSCLLNVLLSHGLVVRTACGGQGCCHLCHVTILAASLPAPNSVEQRALGARGVQQGLRLSCQLVVRAPMSLRLPDLT